MKKHVIVGRILIGLVVALLTTPRPVSAQSTFATLTGVVVDQSGGVLPGASVTVGDVPDETAGRTPSC